MVTILFRHGPLQLSVTDQPGTRAGVRHSGPVYQINEGLIDVQLTQAEAIDLARAILAHAQPMQIVD